MGLRGLAVDKSKERSCGTDILVLDLTVHSQLQLLLDILRAEKDKLLLVFIAPPCGTASRARGRPIKSSLLRGRKAPVPLRTDAQPDGKDGLCETDKLKTELANQLYDAIAYLFSCRCPDPKAALASIKRDKGEAKKKARAQGFSYLDQLFEDQPCMTKPVTVMIYDMKPFLQSCVDRYVQLAGRDAKPLKNASTPFHEEHIARPVADEAETSLSPNSGQSSYEDPLRCPHG